MSWDEYKYWFFYSYREGRFDNIGCGPVVILCVVAVLLLCSCKTPKTLESEKVDSVRVEYKEKIVYVPHQVIVEVPVEAKQRETSDSTSFLETSFAESEASITWKDGVPLLSHSLRNKPQRIVKNDSVAVVEKEKIIRRIIRNTTIKTVYKQYQPAWWQRVLLCVILVILAVISVKHFIYHSNRR